MALDKTIILTRYQAAAGLGDIINIQAGGVTLTPTVEDVDSNTTLESKDRGFVWDGNFFLPYGSSAASTLGYVGYQAEGDTVGILLGWGIDSLKIIPLGDKCLFIGGTKYGYGSSPYLYNNIAGTKSAGDIYDVVLFKDKLIWSQSAKSYVWQHPFTAVATLIAGTISFQRLVEFEGDAYGLEIKTNRYFALHKFDGTIWNQVGGDQDTTTSVLSANPAANVFFRFNGKLWIISHQSATKKVRCWEIDESTGTITERADLVPAAQEGIPSGAGVINAVIDDTGTTRKIYIIINYIATGAGGWHVYEFDDTVEWVLQQNGAHNIGPYSALLWDEDANGVEIRSAVQNVLGHVDMSVYTSNLKTNSAISIDPRYKDTNIPAETPPYNICTEMTGVGSEGKTGLSTKPSGITALADLSDDFLDGIIDNNLWEIVNYSIYLNSFSNDYGIGNLATPADYLITESPNLLLMPRSTVFAQSLGIGYKSKWWINGEFQIDLVIQNLEHLSQNAGNDDYYMCLYVREGQGRGYGILVKKIAGPLYRAKPFVFINGINAAVKGSDSVVNLANGDKIRIARAVGDVWTLTADPDVANETLVLGSNPTFGDPVQIFMFGISHVSSHWSLVATPGCAFGPIVVSGAGTLGKFDAAQFHNFDWDVTTDLGAGFNDIVRTFIDTVV